MLITSNVADERLTTAHRAKLAYVYVRQSSVNQVRQHQESTELQYRRSIVPSVWAGPLEFDLIPVTILFFLVGAVLAWLQKDQNHLDLQINIKPGPIRGAVPMLAKIRVNMRGQCRQPNPAAARC